MPQLHEPALYHLTSHLLNAGATDIINIKTEEAGQTKDVQFACSQEELQDLVTKLKQAVKEVDRIIQA